MSAGKRDLYIEVGADYIDRLRVVDKFGAPKEDYGNGWSAEMHLRELIDSTVTIAEATTADGTIVLFENTITITIPHAVTEIITAKKGVYDLELTSPINEVQRLVEGKVTFAANVTR